MKGQVVSTLRFPDHARTQFVTGALPPPAPKKSKKGKKSKSKKPVFTYLAPFSVALASSGSPVPDIVAAGFAPNHILDARRGEECQDRVDRQPLPTDVTE